MNISILVPTRKRIENVKRFLQSIHDTVLDRKNIEVIFYVDVDDEDTINFLNEKVISNTKIEFATKLHVGPRTQPGVIYNQLITLAIGHIIMVAADDIKFNTLRWDVLVKEEFDFYPDKVALVFGYDGLQPPGSIATHYFLSKRAVSILGYVIPEDFGYNYSDNWMTTMYRNIGRLCYLPIDIEHLHWGAGKAAYDATYAEGSNAPHQVSIDIIKDVKRHEADTMRLKQSTNGTKYTFDVYHQASNP